MYKFILIYLCICYNNVLCNYIEQGSECGFPDQIGTCVEYTKCKEPLTRNGHFLTCNVEGDTEVACCLDDNHNRQRRSTNEELNSLKDELYNNVISGSYDSAVIITKRLDNKEGNEVLRGAVTKLINNNVRNTMAYAYKLWTSDHKQIVRTYFPKSMNQIFDQNLVKIVNKKYHQPLKLDVNTDRYNDRLAWGDNFHDNMEHRLEWQIKPVWINNDVTFKLYNVDCDMYLKLDVNVDRYGDRQAWGSDNSDEDRHRYYLEPAIIDETFGFLIINYKYNQALKLDGHWDGYGDRLLWGHNGGFENENRFFWLIEKS